MGALTNYLESGLLNHIFRNTAYPASATLYIGLIKNFILDDIENGIIDEPAIPRQPYNSNATNWITPYASGSALATHNTSAIEFPIATTNIGNISGVFIADNISSGNVLFYSLLSSSRNIRQNDQFILPSGSLKITFN
jgi:hypothetical protein